MKFTISEQEQQSLLSQARESIKSRLEGREPQYPAGKPGGESALNNICGAFVTLHSVDKLKGRSLRGCIGRMTADLPLQETVRSMAREAAFGDPRFPPLKIEELDRCQIEISVLSPMSLCRNPMDVKVGVHGLFLKRGGRSGVLLPQVPVEQGWNLDEYLDYICTKAWLPKRSYEAKDAELFTFTAVVFGEEED